MKAKDANDIHREEGAEALRQICDAASLALTGPESVRSPIRLLSKSEFTAGFQPPDYVIDGILQRRFIYSLTAKTGDGKTALALLIAKLVGSTAPNASLGSHAVNKGKVVYFAGENPDDLRMRVIADDAKESHDGSADKISFIAGTFDIQQMHSKLQEETERLDGVDLTIVDTSAAFFLGKDEINNTQMGDHARMLRSLTTLPGGPCVLVLCHPIKYVESAAQLLPRGGGSFIAEMDGNLTLWKRDGNLIEFWHSDKFRGPGFEPITLRLEKIETPALVDTKGRLIPTVRAVAISQQEEAKVAHQARSEEDQLLKAMLTENRSIAELAVACDWILTSGEPYKSKVSRVMMRLKGSGLAKMQRDVWQLTNKGKQAAKKVAATASE